MANFTGSNADETITPAFVSPTVVASGGTAPSNAADIIDGGDGNDTIDSSGGNDTVTGGRGSDIAFLGSGDDTFIWNPGDGSDIVEGQDGTDTLLFNGSNANENIDISANGSRVRLFRDVGNVTMDLNGMEIIHVNAVGGTDTISVDDLSGTGVKQALIDLGSPPGSNLGDGAADTVNVNGTAGDDHIAIRQIGSTFVVSGLSEMVTINGAEAANDTIALNGLGGNDTIDGSRLIAGQVHLTIDGGDGDDTIIGSQGNDMLIGGAGNDTITGGKGDDIVFMGDGDDTFVWNPGDGADQVNGDAGNDTVTFNGSNDADAVTIFANGSRVALFDGVGAGSLDIGGVENLVVRTGGGDDVITAGNGLSPLIGLTIDGGAGNDTINGGDGADLLLGGDGNDLVTGGRGNDTAFLGSGNDTFVWNPGDGSDIVEGQGGNDTLLFNGSNANENVDISANGSRTRLFRDVANITMDLNGIENIQFNALGGADNITVDDLTGTGVKQVSIDLSSPPGSGQGDAQADTVIVNGTAANDRINIASSGTSVVVTGLAAPVSISGAEAANDTVVINGLGGNDTIDATRLNAGQINLLIDGGDGDDTIVDGAGNDTLVGGAGNDTITGGAGNDSALMGDGDDTFVWNPGDGSDFVDGGAGNDTVVFNASNDADSIIIAPNGSHVVLFNGVGAGSLDIVGVENLVVHGGGGDDVITAANGLSTLTTLTLDGGAGNDTIIGGDGADLLLGGDGNDIVTGGRGSDTAFLGSGDDTFIWNPGDGSDVVEGQSGNDTLLFNGANVSEHIDISANGSRARFFRDVGNVTMDLNGIENIQFNALGGADNITVEDLSGTGVKQVAIDLSSPPGSGQGDAQPDTVTIDGTAGNNRITVATNGSSIVVSGLPETVTISGAEAGDSLVINGVGGNDTIDASQLAAGQIGLTIDGGDGNDTIIGGRGADVLSGGAGDDTITGGAGNDVALMGDGDDTFVWNPGDGSDTVEGQGGDDTLVFNGSNANESMDISANGTRARLFRDVGNVTMDLNGVETIQLAAAGGADTIVVNDLTGTDVKLVAIDLAAAGTHAGDGQPDQVIVNGTAANDLISVTTGGGNVIVSGLAAQVTIAHAEAANDLLVINGLAGNDIIDASGLGAGKIGLAINGGDGDDVLIGGNGGDIVNGGRGNDVAMLGGGDDTFVWNPGDGSDTVNGQGGNDTLLFNGANVNENVSISANGSLATFTRDVANITMNLSSVENIQFNALGGADNITVNDLTGTGVKQVGISLASPPGSGQGDGQTDTVTINGTAKGDHIVVASNATGVTVSGLPETVTIDGAETIDRLVISAGAGNDVIDASGLAAGSLGMTFIGGTGNDTLIGGASDDTFMFSAGTTGHDTIQGFQVHGAGVTGDIVALAGFADQSLAQAIADGHIAQYGANVVISDGSSTIATLQNVALGSLQARDFAFS